MWRRRSAVPGHLHPQLSAVEHPSVHGVERVFGVPLVVEPGTGSWRESQGAEYVPDEGEASALAGEAVPGDVDIADVSTPLEDPPEVLGGGAIC